MLHVTKGIVFHSFKYSESSVIVKIYTELFGIQSYLFKGILGPKSRIKPGLLQPLTLLDLVVYHKEKHSLQSVKEIHLAHPYQTIPFDIRKSAVALFINELVYKTIKEEESNPDLFEFLWTSCLQLDLTDEPVSSFHLVFSLNFSRYLGIFPQLNYTEKIPIFNLREGFFQSSVPGHPDYLNPGNSKRFYSLLNACSQTFAGVQNFEPLQSHFEPLQSMKAETRNQLLETILLYYRLHLPGFSGLQSPRILHEVMA